MRTISSHPGAGLFRSVVSIVIIVIIATYFLYKTERLSRDAEIIAMQNMVNEINSALSLVVYQLAMNKNLAGLSRLDQQNPFYYLALSQRLPEKYRGVVSSEADITQSGWYFSQSDSAVVYRGSDDQNFKFELNFRYSDRNNSGEFEPENDTITSLMMQAR
ncbi:MAG: hypothetical protein H8E21_05855 [Gammaproteobacteria bacterium]|nr:hypothetical protein [Gammaproteobacteria bacterium]MBL7000335.1 hypothetical protein [Gammaproteobacteria bacterium]